MWRFLGFGVLLTVMFASCSMQQVTGARSTVFAVQTYRNPHHVCTDCHPSNEPKKGGRLFAPGTDPSSDCLACHNYKENHHPVDFTPVGAPTFPLPLFDGKVRCLTCHVIHGGADHEGTPRLLRNGPFKDRRASCSQCHDMERYASIDPHKMLDARGNIVEIGGKPICLLCHSKKPDPEVDTTNDVKFRADVGFLCWRCHPPMPGSFFEKHFLVRPTAQTLKNIREAEERLLVIFPLVPWGRITCSTCHNPHQAGVIRRESAAKGAGSHGKLRLPSICFGCHRMSSGEPAQNFDRKG